MSVVLQRMWVVGHVTITREGNRGFMDLNDFVESS